MICQAWPMQISGANLLIASQQAKAQSNQATPAGVNFMAALAKSKTEALFAPLDFKPAENAAPAKPSAAPQPSQNSPVQRPGANLDIRI